MYIKHTSKSTDFCLRKVAPAKLLSLLNQEGDQRHSGTVWQGRLLVQLRWAVPAARPQLLCPRGLTSSARGSGHPGCTRRKFFLFPKTPLSLT